MVRTRKQSIRTLLKKLKTCETKLRMLNSKMRLNNPANSRTNQNIVNNARRMNKKNLSFHKRRSRKFRKKYPKYNQGNN